MVLNRWFRKNSKLFPKILFSKKLTDSAKNLRNLWSISDHKFLKISTHFDNFLLNKILGKQFAKISEPSIPTPRFKKWSLYRAAIFSPKIISGTLSYIFFPVLLKQALASMSHIMNRSRITCINNWEILPPYNSNLFIFILNLWIYE